MRIERRLFIDVKSHWSYVCILVEKLELKGWRVMFRPELNAIDILKYSYDGYDIVDDLSTIISSTGSQWGIVRSIYDIDKDDKLTRWLE